MSQSGWLQNIEDWRMQYIIRLFKHYGLKSETDVTSIWIYSLEIQL
jgi:hypothetical protein